VAPDSRFALPEAACGTFSNGCDIALTTVQLLGLRSRTSWTAVALCREPPRLKSGGGRELPPRPDRHRRGERTLQAELLGSHKLSLALLTSGGCLELLIRTGLAEAIKWHHELLDILVDVTISFRPFPAVWPEPSRHASLHRCRVGAFPCH
jgi:hypothetical protein